MTKAHSSLPTRGYNLTPYERRLRLEASAPDQCGPLRPMGSDSASVTLPYDGVRGLVADNFALLRGAHREHAGVQLD